MGLIKCPCSRTAPSSEKEEGIEDGWHNKEERDKRPEPLEFKPVRRPGPTLNPTVAWTPLSLFQLFFSHSVVSTIVANTNANAAKRLKAGLKFVWKPLTVREFYIFLAIIIYSGLVKVHDSLDYWREEWPYNFRFPGDTMTRDRFKSIMWSLHMSNPEEDKVNERKKKTAEYDRLFKIKPLYTEIVNACKLHFQPYQNITIDERMVAFQACRNKKRYKKAKPRKRAYKIFVLADSLTAYTWNFFVYEGKSARILGQRLSDTSVMNLMEFPLLGQGYTLFIDSSSPALFEELSRRKTGACGTITKTQFDFPKTVQNDLPQKAERGDMRWIRKNNLLFVKWIDTHEVTICSTVHEAFSGQTVKRRAREAGIWKMKDVTVPDPIVAHNRNMGSMDLWGTLINEYSVHHKTKKWYRTFFYHFIDVAVVNSFLLHKELLKEKNSPTTKRPYSKTYFREKLTVDMLEFAEVSVPPPPPPKPTVCMPAYFGDDDGKHCKRCHVKTPVYCMKCDIPLCLTAERNCFKEWHNENPNISVDLFFPA